MTALAGNDPDPDMVDTQLLRAILTAAHQANP